MAYLGRRQRHGAPSGDSIVPEDTLAVAESDLATKKASDDAEDSASKVMAAMHHARAQDAEREATETPKEDEHAEEDEPAEDNEHATNATNTTNATSTTEEDEHAEEDKYAEEEEDKDAEEEEDKDAEEDMDAQEESNATNATNATEEDEHVEAENGPPKKETVTEHFIRKMHETRGH